MAAELDHVLLSLWSMEAHQWALCREVVAGTLQLVLIVPNRHSGGGPLNYTACKEEGEKRPTGLRRSQERGEESAGSELRVSSCPIPGSGAFQDPLMSSSTAGKQGANITIGMAQDLCTAVCTCIATMLGREDCKGTPSADPHRL